LCLENPNHGPDAEPHLACNRFDGQTIIPQADYFGAVEDAFGPANRLPRLRPMVASIIHAGDGFIAEIGLLRPEDDLSGSDLRC
jgi:hypothetical protein